MITVTNLTKEYRDGDTVVHALRGVSMEINQGEFISIAGPSGSGKTTLLNILGCLDRPSSGTYILDGERVGDMKEEALARVRNEKIGFVFQSFNLLPRLNALENVMLPFLYNAKPPSDPVHKAREALEKVGLGNRIYHLPSQLSGGQQQRVAIARSLINNPDIILADEPTGALDSRSGLEIMALLQEFNERDSRTVLVITHEDTIARHCLRVVTLKDGTVVSVSDNVGQRLRAVESLAALEVQA